MKMQEPRTPFLRDSEALRKEQIIEKFEQSQSHINKDGILKFSYPCISQNVLFVITEIKVKNIS